MADRELVVKIPEELLNKIDDENYQSVISWYATTLYCAIKDGKEKAKSLEQEQQTFEWCETCKEYDQEKHCCHRWSKVIRDTVEEMKQEPKWIPVSEKLPEPFTFVNATCRSLVDDRENWVVETVYLPIPKEANKHGYSDWGNIPMLNWGEAEVIAWAERIIPQPYKAESEET